MYVHCTHLHDFYKRASHAGSDQSNFIWELENWMDKVNNIACKLVTIVLSESVRKINIWFGVMY